jgi:hypothetical protein
MTPLFNQSSLAIYQQQCYWCQSKYRQASAYMQCPLEHGHIAVCRFSPCIVVCFSSSRKNLHSSHRGSFCRRGRGERLFQNQKVYIRTSKGGRFPLWGWYDVFWNDLLEKTANWKPNWNWWLIYKLKIWQ